MFDWVLSLRLNFLKFCHYRNFYDIVFPLISTSGTYLISKLFRLRRLKEGGTSLKIRGIIPMKFQNFVIFTFQIKNKYDIRFVPYYILT